MSRFKWSSPRSGRVINRYIDMICRDYPAVAKDVVKNGIGDLESWFEDSRGYTCPVGSAKCGCLVGTTALVAMKRFKKAAERIDGSEYDAAKVLYDVIVAATKRDVSRYVKKAEADYGSGVDAYAYDPLYTLIQEAGSIAATEAGWYDWELHAPGYDRAKEVTDRIEMRIRRNLNIPLPKKYQKAA